MRRLCAFSLACLFLFPLFAGTVLKVSAADTQNKTDVWEWAEITEQSDLPSTGSYPMLLCYTDQNGKDYFMTRNSVDGQCTLWCSGGSQLRSSENGKGKYTKASPVSDYPEIKPGEPSFLTKTLPTDWVMRVNGDQTDGCKTIRIRCGSKELDDAVGWLGMAVTEWTDFDDGDDYCIYTRELGGDRKTCTREGCVQIYYYDDSWFGVDTGLCWDGNKVGGIEGNVSYYSSFRLFYGRKISLSTIVDDLIIGPGSTYYAYDNLMIADGANVIVEPGGVLYVDGLLYNNGVIHNCGSMIVNPDSCIACKEPKSQTAGQINCYGAGGSASFTVLKTELGVILTELREQYEKDIDNLNKQVMYAEWDLSMFESEYRKYLEMSDEEKVVLPGIETMYEQLQKTLKDAEDAYRALSDEYQTKIRLAKEQYSDDGITEKKYSGCEGYLLIMKEGSIVFSRNSESTLNLYCGAICVNNGLLISPNAMTVSDSEFINRASAHIFLGRYYMGVEGSRLAQKIRYAGTSGAYIEGLELCGTASSIAVETAAGWHIRNTGTWFQDGWFHSDSGNFVKDSRFEEGIRYFGALIY